MILFSFTKGLNPEYEAKQIKAFYKELDMRCKAEKRKKLKTKIKNIFVK